LRHHPVAGFTPAVRSRNKSAFIPSRFFWNIGQDVSLLVTFLPDALLN